MNLVRSPSEIINLSTDKGEAALRLSQSRIENDQKTSNGVKALMRKFIPRPVLGIYHFILAHLAALVYGFPSRKMIVMGVTGTKGKSTTSYLIAKIMEGAGFRVGLTSTAIFKISGKEWLNATKMTMPGRFALQKMLCDMVRAGCTYAIVETSSEGISQYRHKGIDYDVAVFTNLTPEHIESHGGFPNYKKAKGKLFASLAGSARKKIGNGKKIIVSNADDEHADYFLSFWADEKIGFGTKELQATSYKLQAYVRAKAIELGSGGSRFTINDVKVESKLIGRANVMNALCAMTVAVTQGVALEQSKRVLEKVESIPGRMEFIREGQPFTVIVDYAHEPESTRELYESVKMIPHGRIIHVFGSTGGGRDISRRFTLGELAGSNADIVIVTNDDPYDDDPREIAEMVASGARKAGKSEGKNLFIILDRRDAIRRAASLAEGNDLVLVTGKGCEQVMVLGKEKIPWDDRAVAREEIKKILL